MRQRGQAIAFFTNALRDDPTSGKFAFAFAGKHTFVVWEICLGKTYALDSQAGHIVQNGVSGFMEGDGIGFGCSR